MDISNGQVIADAAVNERRFKVIEDHLFSELQDEAVILSLRNGKYFGLNTVGVSIWRALTEAATHRDVVEAVMAEYDVEREVCEKEVTRFIDEMSAEGLLDVVS